MKIDRNGLRGEKMSLRRKIDLLALKSLEEEMLRLGTEIKAIDKELSEWKTHPENLKRPLYAYATRSRWLKEILNELDRLYVKVNDEVKTIINLLYLENKSLEEVSEHLGKSVKHVRKIHQLIVSAVAENIGIIGLREANFQELSRYIPKKIKQKVWEKYNGRCAFCGNEDNLHYHHIQYFSEGGTHNVDNLMILCAECHAEVHKGEKAYHALLALAQERD